MTEKWKNTIAYRIKQRNIHQSEIYGDILFSYNALVEEKNKLLAIIASYTSENIYLRNGKNLGFAGERNLIGGHSLYGVANGAVVDASGHEEFVNGMEKGRKGNSYTFVTANPMDNSKSRAINSSSSCSRSIDNYSDFVSKRECMEGIKEKGKSDELILHLKNGLHEKEKHLNMLRKENKILNSTITEREDELLVNRKKLFKIEQILNKKNQEIKLYANNNKSLRSKVEVRERQNAKLVREYDYLRFTYFKLLKEAYAMKAYKRKMDREYFSLRSELLKKKVENENLLKYLLKCKKWYKRQLKKFLCRMDSKMGNINVAKKGSKNKHIFFKKRKAHVCLYLHKLNPVHSQKGIPQNKDTQCDNCVLLIQSNRPFSSSTKSNDFLETPEVVQNDFQVEIHKRMKHASKLGSKKRSKKYTILKGEKEVVQYRNSRFREHSQEDKNCESSSIEIDLSKNEANNTFRSIKSVLNAHNSSSILCFTSISSTHPNDDITIFFSAKNKENAKIRSRSLNMNSKINNLRSYTNTFKSGITNSCSNTIMMEQCFIKNKEPLKNTDIDESFNSVAITCGDDGNIAFIHVKENELKCIKRFYILESKIPAHSICIHPSHVYSLVAMKNNTMCLVSNVKNKVEHLYYDHKEKVTSVNFLCDYNYTDDYSMPNSQTNCSHFYTTSLDKMVKIWNMEKNCSVHTIYVNDLITSSSISHRGAHILVGTQDGSILCYDIRVHNKSAANSILYHKNVFTKKICGLNFSPDDQLIAIQSIDGKIKLLNANKNNYFQSFETPDYVKNYIPTSYPIFSPDRKKLICTYPYNLISYDVLTHSYTTILNNEFGQINGTNLVLSDKLLTVHADGNVAIW
ncbi:conserved Plasmodium protein, unknown function [Plasmodium ovale]|nr:conserved Plasmodium protein, unknown function [Plasmodium ovale curtisi]SCQ17309.1 conserved Plasmodium protein, unknown function [Plasmodium ovale]